MKFGWEIKAIQKDYDTLRLEEHTIEEPKNDNLTEDLFVYLQNLLYNYND